MRKERLKSIKRKTVYLEGTGDLMMAINTDDYRWLLKQAERVQVLENKLENVMDRHTYLEGDYYDLQKQNERYREAIESIKIELRDFRKDANTIKKLSRDRIVQGEAFRLSCDIRDCLKALESESE